MPIESENTKILREGVSEWLAYLGPMLNQFSSHAWSGDDREQSWEFLKRAAVKRQWEGVEAIIKMTDAGFGHFGVTLLRPAYEELIWIEYLDRNPTVTKELIALLAMHEVADSMKAQNDYFGKKGMQNYGFTQRLVKVMLARDRESEAKIRKIGQLLGWNMTRSLLPSMNFLSRKVNREAEYKFLYHATSRFVHFSVQENFRRVWGKKGDVEIGSSTFSAYWQDFALYWGFRLFLQLVIHFSDMLTEINLPAEKHEEMISWLRKFPMIPILTLVELESWSGPNPLFSHADTQTRSMNSRTEIPPCPPNSTS